jgi:diphthine-ammonia ligase
MRGVVLWTGGKDSALALHRIAAQGHRVVGLVTFVPEGAEFLAHPLEILSAQAAALGLPHRSVAVAEPYDRSYERALSEIRKDFRADAVITGDIAEVDGYPNWIRERSRPVGLKAWTPLWQEDRLHLLSLLCDLRFQVIFSGVRAAYLGEEWAGRELNRSCLSTLRAVAEEKGMDLCGEQGEYHTLVLDAPLFRGKIEIRDSSRKVKEDLTYLQISRWAFVPK